MIFAALLWALIAIACFVLLATAVVVSTPLHIQIAIDSLEEIPVRARIGILGGALRFNLPQSTDDKSTDVAPKKPKRARSSFTGFTSRALRKGPRTALRLLSCFKIKHLAANIAYGLPDPAETGMLYGVFSSFTRSFHAISPRQFNLRPNFNHATLQGEGNLILSVAPIVLIPPLFAFGWSVFMEPRFKKMAIWQS